MCNFLVWEKYLQHVLFQILTFCSKPLGLVSLVTKTIFPFPSLPFPSHPIPSLPPLNLVSMLFVVLKIKITTTISPKNNLLEFKESKMLSLLQILAHCDLFPALSGVDVDQRLLFSYVPILAYNFLRSQLV